MAILDSASKCFMIGKCFFDDQLDVCSGKMIDITDD